MRLKVYPVAENHLRGSGSSELGLTERVGIRSRAGAALLRRGQPPHRLPMKGTHYLRVLSRRRELSGGLRVERARFGGEGGIRTHGRVTPTAVFETARFGRSRTSPFVIMPMPRRDSVRLAQANRLGELTV